MKIETFEIKEGNMALLKPSAELYWKAQRRPFWWEKEKCVESFSSVQIDK